MRINKYLIILLVILFFGIISAEDKGVSNGEGSQLVGEYGLGKNGVLSYLGSQDSENYNLRQTAAFATSKGGKASAEDIQAINQAIEGGFDRINKGMSGIQLQEARQELSNRLMEQLSQADQQIMQNMQKAYNYVQEDNENFKINPDLLLEKQKGSIEINNKGDMTIKSSDEETGPLGKKQKIFAEIPKGYEIQDNREEFSVVNKNADMDDVLEIENHKFSNVEQNSEISFFEKNGINTLKLKKGKADITIGERNYYGVKDAIIKTDKKNNVKFAEFTSVNGGEYRFDYNDKEYKFNSKKNGKIKFNPDEKIIEGENVDFEFEGGKIESEKFKAKIDDKGNVEEMNTEGLTKYLDSNGYEFYSNNPLSIFYNKKDIKNFEGNAISIFEEDGELKINSKGKVMIKKPGEETAEDIVRAELFGEKKQTINYRGLSEDAYVEVDTKNNFFDLKKGDATLDNGAHSVLIENGKAKLSAKTLSKGDSEAQSFTFKHYSEGREIQGTVDESSRSLNLIAYEKGKVTNTALIPLSSYEGSLSEPSQMQASLIRAMENNLESLKNSGATPEQLSAAELALKNAQNRQFQNFYGTAEGLDKSIGNIRDFLESKRDIKSEMNAKMNLAELLIKRAHAGPDFRFEGQGLDAKSLWEKAEDFNFYEKQYYSEAIDLYKEIKDYAKDKNQELFEQASVSLGRAYLGNSDTANSIRESYDLINRASSNEMKSQGYLNLGMSRIAEQDYALGLQNLKRALVADPNNIMAREKQKEIQLGIVNLIGKNINERFELASEELKGALGDGTFWNSFGKEFYGDITGRNKELIDEYNSVISKLFDDEKGIPPLTKLIEGGYHPGDFLSASYDNKIGMMADSMGLGDVSKLSSAELKMLKEQVSYTTSSLENRDLKRMALDGFSDLSSYEKDFNNLRDREIEFGFKTGEDDYKHIGDTTSDKLFSAYSGKNIIMLGFGGAVAKGAGGVLKFVPGAEKVINGFNGAKTSIAEARILQEVSKQLPTFGKVAGVLIPEAAETGAGLVVGSILGQTAGEFTEILSGNARLFDVDLAEIAGKKIGKNILFDEAGEAIGSSLSFETKEQLESYVEAGVKQGKLLQRQGDNFFETPGGQKVWVSAEAEPLILKQGDGLYSGYSLTPSQAIELNSGSLALKQQEIGNLVEGNGRIITPVDKVPGRSVESFEDEILELHRNEFQQLDPSLYSQNELIDRLRKNPGEMFIATKNGEFLGFSNHNFYEVKPELIETDQRIIDYASQKEGEMSKKLKDFFDKRAKDWGVGKSEVEYFDNIFTRGDFKISDKDMRLSDIAVVEASRREGVGQSLVEEEIRLAKKRNADAIFAYAAEGRGSEELLRKLGFEPIIKYSPAYHNGDGATFMGLRLSPQSKGIPLGFKDVNEFTDFKKTITLELDNLPFSYNPSQVKVVGSSVTGFSSGFSSTPYVPFVRDSNHDYDISIVVSKEEFNQIYRQVHDSLERLATARPNSRWAGDLKKLEQKYAKTGQLNAFYLNHISSDTKFEGNLYDIGEKFGVKKVQVSVIREGSDFDVSNYISF